jgi:hypothetical protein
MSFSYRSIGTEITHGGGGAENRVSKKSGHCHGGRCHGGERRVVVTEEEEAVRRAMRPTVAT